jgi:hypothetical protein
MRPAFNLEPKYRVTMLTREEWTRGPGTPPIVKWLIWFTDGSKMVERTGDADYGQSLGRQLNIPIGKYATIFLAELYAIQVCIYEIETQGRPQKYFSI